jgi:DNA-binding XRE family transcriptional regulator
MFAYLRYFCLAAWMRKANSIKNAFSETQLAALAKRFRAGANISKAEAARQLGVNRGTIQQAEEYPETSLTRLRLKMIEVYSPFKIVGPVYFLEKK